MNARWFRNFCAVCVVILMWAAIFVTAGCAGEGLKVSVETTGEGASAEKTVNLETDYQVENGFKMERDGDGYKIDLGSATTKDAETGVMIEMLRMMQAMMGVAGVLPATEQPTAQEKAAADVQGVYEAGINEGRRLQSEEFNNRN